MKLAPVKSKVLVVESQREVAEIIAICLRRAGFETTIARSGTEGIRLADQEEFDLVTTETDLSDMSGFEICAYLKEDFRFVRTPIIFISSPSTEEDRRRAFESGAADFIIKPFDPSVLIARILSHVKPIQQ
jgi:DNA-binding response OmpR family regulator